MSKLTGKAGQILLGDKVVAAKTQWNLNVDRGPIDATVFGESKTYHTKTAEISGSFRMTPFAEVSTTEPQHMYLYAAARPAWWGRFRHWVMRTEWPRYIFASGPAKVEMGRAEDGVFNGVFTFDGPPTISTPPMSRLERYWDRLLHPQRWREAVAWHELP